MRISLGEAITRDMREPGMAGVYRADGTGTYFRGRPMFSHSEGVFTLSLSVWNGGCWEVRSGDRGHVYLMSRTAPSMCPADPRAARCERRGRTH